MSEITVNGKAVPFPAQSPNQLDRAGNRPQLIVLHSTGGRFDGAVSWLKNPKSSASAHFVVSRKGEIVQLVPMSRAAWHAGKAEWNGNRHVNPLSIGIEMEHFDGKQDWPDVQLEAVARLCGAIIAKYPAIFPPIIKGDRTTHDHISLAHIVGHHEVATPRGRKVDPRDFPWATFRAKLAGYLE